MTSLQRSTTSALVATAPAVSFQEQRSAFITEQRRPFVIPSKMEEKPWWQTGVIYQVYPRSYKDTTDNGVGDLAGILEKLPYLQEILGIDAIWLSPFYPSPMADFGYDVADYTNVDPLFGSLEIFDKLIEAAHTRKIKIVIDFVPNHSSDQHTWFQESRSSRDNPKRDWYVWADPKPDGGPPNNWVAVFGGSAWEYDPKTGQYYLHSFLKEQPDLNWRNPQLKQAMLDAMRFWLERGVDGFRIDVAHFMMKDPLLRDNPPNLQRTMLNYKSFGDEYESQLHLYDKGHADIHPLLKEFRQVLDSYSSKQHPRYSVGEVHIFEWDEWATYYGSKEQLDELHMPFNFALLKEEWKAGAVQSVVDGLEGALPEGAWPNYVLGNHDEPRLVTRLGPAQSRVAAVLLLTLRGTPTLYYGDELGMASADIPLEQQHDPWGKRVPGLGRDGCRTPMQWNSQGGFSNNPKTWLPMGQETKGTNVESEMRDPDSMLNLYRRLLALRRQTPALHEGSYRAIPSNNDDCFVFLRQDDESGGDTILVALNFSSRSQHIELPGLEGERLLSTHDLDSVVNMQEELFLQADEGVVVRLEEGFSDY